jgi:acyl-CoA synthetase (AMP-forming)/AMP-acid ligase II
MLGLMQDWSLLIHRVIDHAAIQHGGREVITRTTEGGIRRSSYARTRSRALQIAQRLDRDGIERGDRIATLAWNTDRHLELWYGITGIGAIYHTLNPRLFEDQIVWIAKHAEDRMMFLDLTFVALMERLQERLPNIERFVIMTDVAHMPDTTLRGVVDMESWLAEADGDFAWVDVPENTAAGLCYTSGTTGNPKGVLYSHRSNVLHALACSAPDFLGLSSRDAVMPVVPLFHANGWSLAFSAPMNGSKLVMPGPRLDGPSLHRLMEDERVTITAAVPTVWLGLLNHLDATEGKLTSLKRVVIGGSACPRAMTEAFETRYGVTVAHAWGMTEMSPLGSFCSVKPAYDDLAGDMLLDLKMKQGHPPFTVEMKITDDAGTALPWDGKTYGGLKVRGPAVAASYMRGDGGDILDDEGFFDTGDVATIDGHGYMAITDRAKDVIKSGGEWISSIELENLAMGHPDVHEAAVIGIAHPRWDERPLLVIVPKPGCAPTHAALLAFMTGKIAKWWLPDDIALVEALPHTATGKIQKTALREMFKGYRFPV